MTADQSGEMVERAARAAFDAYYPVHSDAEWALFRRLWLNAFRVGLSAMREPTPAMIEVGHTYSWEYDRDYAARGWAAMLDVALDGAP